jgi:hypothetical protein
VTTFLALDAAIDRLAEVDPRAAEVVECRFFAGTHRGGNGVGTRHLAAHGEAGLAHRAGTPHHELNAAEQE